MLGKEGLHGSHIIRTVDAAVADRSCNRCHLNTFPDTASEC